MDKKNIVVNDDIINQWQDFLNIVAIRFGVPVALVMKVDLPDIKVFLANKSESNPYEVGESACLFDSGLYCERVYKTNKELLIPNALKDKEWDKNPDIKLGMISYLGFPILWPDGEVFGTTCVLDVKENAYCKKYENILLQFKEYIEAYLDLSLSRYLKKSEEEILEKDLRCDSLLSKAEKMLLNCIYMAKCPLFKLFKLQATADTIAKRYCKGSYEKCERKKLRDAGKDVPERLLPDGDILPEAGRKEYLTLYASKFKQEIP